MSRVEKLRLLKDKLQQHKHIHMAHDCADDVVISGVVMCYGGRWKCRGELVMGLDE